MDGRPTGEPPREDWARRNAGWVAIAALLFGGWMAVLGPGDLPRPPSAIPRGGASSERVLTPGAIAQWGNAAAMNYLRGLDGGRVFTTIERARAAVVRFEIKAKGERESGQSRNWASGVLVNGGRHVLTAAHVLDLDGANIDLQCSVMLPDGRTLKARLPAVQGGRDGAPEGDWAMLELESAFLKGLPALEMASVRDDATIVLLSYSGGWGVDDRGTVLPADPSEGRLRTSPLWPLVFAAILENAQSGRSNIVAGVQPSGGMSGGAIVDMRGRLVGIAAGYSHSRVSGLFVDEVGLGDSSPSNGYRETLGLFGTPATVFRAFLEERWKR